MSSRRRNIRTQTDEELAELERAEEERTRQANQPGATTTGQPEVPPPTSQILTMPTPTIPTQEEDDTGESRSHLVKHRAPRAETEEEQFDSVYKRDTYYIDRTYIPRLKKLIKKSQHTKTRLLNEALDLLFEKYGSE